MPTQKFVKTKKIRLINVYMSADTKEKVLELMDKYHVSTSTIIDKACEYLAPIQIFTMMYQDKNAKFRSHYKPKFITEHPLETANQETIYCTNALYMAVNHFEPMKELIKWDEKKRNSTYNKFLADLNKCRDIYWDYNATLRTRYRADKEIRRRNKC